MDERISKVENIKSYLNFGKVIKSMYNFKEIISFLGKKEFFNIIVYNKELQKALKIDIEDYKKVSGKYKIGKKDGIGKVYKINTNILIFEGEYLNKEKNGKGKEYYDNGKLKFEGEYLNGERNGNGKEYYDNGKLKFEGEYLKGKKWNGKGYNINGYNEFEIINGNGKGKEYYDNDILKFEGEYLNRERNGKGKEYYENDKLKFEGEYLNGERNGKIKFRIE